MPARLPPGLYERLVSLALDAQIRGLDAKYEASIEEPEDAERPRLLARYIHDLLSLALEAQTGKDAEAKQLNLCRRVLAQLIEAETGLVVEDDTASAPSGAQRGRSVITEASTAASDNTSPATAISTWSPRSGLSGSSTRAAT